MICKYCKHYGSVVWNNDAGCTLAGVTYGEEGYGPWKGSVVCLLDPDLSNRFEEIGDDQTKMEELIDQNNFLKNKMSDLRDENRELKYRLTSIRGNNHDRRNQ